MKFTQILKNRLVIYLLGLIVGIAISFMTFSVYINAKSVNLENDLQIKMAQYEKKQRLVYENKDYILAGILLSPENRQKIDEKVVELSAKEQQKIRAYIDIKIKPIYRLALSNYANQKLKKINLTNIVSRLKIAISNKVINLLPTVSEKLKRLIINSININKQSLVSNLKKLITGYVQQNKGLIITTVQTQVASYVQANKTVILANVKETLLAYGQQNNQVISDFVMAKGKQFIRQYIDGEIDFNLLLSNLQTEIREKILNSDLAEDVEHILAQIEFLVSDVDDDYHFDKVTINGNQVDVSFLNIIDLYIEPVTANYDNNKTPFNISDDQLVIKDIYVNLEALDGRGIDIIIGQIHFEGIVAYLIFNSIGVVNEQI